MAKYKLLLVEDEHNFGSVLKNYLQISGFDCEWATDGAKAWSILKSNKQFDCLILDVMMPEMDGFTLAKALRKSEISIPMIFLTARNMREDIINGYELGAIDYIPKPFDTEILIYKLNALLSNQQQMALKQSPNSTFHHANIEFSPQLRTLTIDNQTQKLSPKENALLLLLWQESNLLVSREKIIKSCWEEDNYFTRRSMDVYMVKLRKKLGLSAHIDLISVHAGGYMLTLK